MASTIWTTRTYEDGSGVLHLSAADTAKCVRKALKDKFPGQKFSVLTDNYSMGASVTVSWVDGPTGREVDEVVRIYSGADFDGMIDLKTHNRHWMMPDGTVTLAHAGGQGSTVPEVIGDPPAPDARLVRFGADYIMTQRRLSPEVEATIRQEIAEFVGGEFPEHAPLPVATFLDDGIVKLAHDQHGYGVYAGTLVWQIGCQRSYYSR